MNFFHPHFHVWKDHHYHQRFFCGEFSHPGTTKMKQEYSFACSHFFFFNTVAIFPRLFWILGCDCYTYILIFTYI
jgi:hypothetical protein